ncbi:epimerase [uncultured Shimia sp.]|uniref:epimerase n=1 Tax=uncultured Shimia sp. TaxID=573152 RepID=UPI002616E077|nr:epimerase [uncultured Shimia sp.]
MTQTVLILGASGRFGHNASLAFKQAGWQVRHFDRQKDTLREAVHGVQVIVNAWNPPYPDWAKQVPRLHAQVIEAARTVDATVIIPGNVYVYGPDNEAVWHSSTPHLARNPLGRIRIDLEAAYRDSNVRTIILRAGDFLDTRESGNWFDMILAKPLPKGVFRYPGRTDIPHAWAYLPDLTRAAVLLAEQRDKLNRFEDIPFPGYTLSGQQMRDALSEIAGRDLRLKQVNWLPFRIMSPFWKLAACLLEMRYLWNTPHELGSERFDDLLPEFEVTPVHTALRRAISWQDQKPSSVPVSTSTQTSR